VTRLIKELREIEAARHAKRFHTKCVCGEGGDMYESRLAKAADLIRFSRKEGFVAVRGGGVVVLLHILQ